MCVHDPDINKERELTWRLLLLLVSRQAAAQVEPWRGQMGARGGADVLVGSADASSVPAGDEQNQ